MVGACSSEAPSQSIPAEDSQPAAASQAQPPELNSAPAQAVLEVQAPAEESALPSIEAPAAPAASLATGTLSQAEIEGLLFMREEEKLAHDVYQALYAAWGLNLFQNIAASEQTHMDSLLVLVDRYSLADPASSQPGVFANPDLQALYAQLIAQGSTSLAEALKAGAAVEEIDILDLQARSAQTSQPDILKVYASLEKGSTNHLRSFVRTLETQAGEAYQPQYLSPDAFAAILSTAMQNGGPGGTGGRDGASGGGRGGPGGGGQP